MGEEWGVTDGRCTYLWLNELQAKAAAEKKK